MKEDRIDMFDTRLIVFAEAKSVSLHQQVLQILQRLRIEHVVAWRVLVCGQQLIDGGGVLHSVWPFSAEQSRKKFDPAGGQLEQAFVHKVLEQILAADVHNERELWL